MSEDYEVGYRKPPKNTQFKKGQSGNRKGRPKGSRNFSTDLKDTLKEPVRLTKGGKRKTVTTQLAALLQLRKKALSGEGRALDGLIELARTYNDEDIAEGVATLSQTDAETLKAYEEEVLQRAGMAQSNNNDETRNDSCQDTNKAMGNGCAPQEEDDDAWLE